MVWGGRGRPRADTLQGQGEPGMPCPLLRDKWEPQQTHSLPALFSWSTGQVLSRYPWE